MSGYIMANKKSKEDSSISSTKKNEELQKMNQDLSEIEDEIPIPEEAIQKLEPEHQKMVRKMFTALTIQSGIREHPFLKKLTSEHITNLINNDEKSGIRECDDRRDIRKNNNMILWSILGFIIFVCIFFTLTNNKDTMFEILKIIAAFAGGFGAGYGISSYNKKQ